MPGIALNEDNSHFYFSRAGRRLTEADVASWVDQYADTQVRELLLCPNCMRTSYDSAVWDPIWRGYDPAAPDDQPLLASLPAADRATARNWIHTAWQLARDGIDPYAVWIKRAREVGLSPWLSMRMNDVHYVDDERAYIHSEFWRSRPDLRRVTDRFAVWQDRAFDYGQAEVRAYHFALIEELAARYDFDGLELDWMRFGFHFRPGYEAEGAALLTGFTRDVRRLLDGWQERRGHAIKLGARVPSRPATALGLGMDAVTWARQGLVDMLVVTPFWATCEPDMPIETWRGLLDGTPVLLAAGLEILVRSHPGGEAQENSLETARGAATALLDRGADRLYLFNYMDDPTGASPLLGQGYQAMLGELGSLETMTGKPRRHVVTYADTWAPGEPRAIPLPAHVGKGGRQAFRVPVGPAPAGAVEVRLGLGAPRSPSPQPSPLGRGGDLAEAGGWQVKLNGQLCGHIGEAKLDGPHPACPVHAWQAPVGAAHRGYNLVDAVTAGEAEIEWVELYVER